MEHTPRWTRFEEGTGNPVLCTDCRQFTPSGYQYWSEPTVATLTLCDSCAAWRLGEEGV